MPRAKNPKADEAEKLYLNGLKLKDIDSRLDLPQGTARRWKKRYEWRSEHPDDKTGVGKKCGAPKGNQNAVGNSGGGAPLGNSNAEKYGFFRKYLPEETFSIIQEMPGDPLDILWDQIQIAYAAIIRAQGIMHVGREKTKEKKQAWERQSNFLQAQARAQKTLESMINRYQELLHKNWELVTEEQRARVALLKVQQEKLTKECREAAKDPDGVGLTVQFYIPDNDRDGKDQ